MVQAAKNWTKLLDVNATTKVWIYVCREKQKADEMFDDATKEFRRPAKCRGEDVTNNVTMFLKTSATVEVRKHYLFE